MLTQKQARFDFVDAHGPTVEVLARQGSRVLQLAPRPGGGGRGREPRLWLVLCHDPTRDPKATDTSSGRREGLGSASVTRRVLSRKLPAPVPFQVPARFNR